MLINIWSTPRTGSNWLSFFLKNKFKKLYSNVIFLSEPFNPYHYKLYYEESKNGEILNHQHYKAGFFWNRYELDKNKKIQIVKTYGPQTDSWEDEQKNRLAVILAANESGILINHNHLSPIDTEIFDFLNKVGLQNYFTYRVDKKMQLSSYAIAYHTKKFISFKSQINSEKYSTNIVDNAVIENLCQRILRAAEMAKLIKPCLAVAYEDLYFSDFENSPQKQIENPWNQLNSDDKVVILNILKKYELL